MAFLLAIAVGVTALVGARIAFQLIWILARIPPGTGNRAFADLMLRRLLCFAAGAGACLLAVFIQCQVLRKQAVTWDQTLAVLVYFVLLFMYVSVAFSRMVNLLGDDPYSDVESQARRETGGNNPLRMQGPINFTPTLRALARREEGPRRVNELKWALGGSAIGLLTTGLAWIFT